jgi:PAS domain S-box-containing protein
MFKINVNWQPSLLFVVVTCANLAFAMGIFIIDSLIGAGAAVCVLYALVIHITAYLPGRKTTLLMAILTTLLIIMSHFIKPKAEILVWSIHCLTRLFSIMVIWGSAWIIIKQKTLFKNLMNTETKLQSIISASPNAIIKIDTDGLVVFHNQRAEEIFGYSPRQFEKIKIEDLLHKRFRNDCIKYRLEYQLNPSQNSFLDRDLLGQHQDGHAIPIELGLTPLSLNHKPYLLCTITDISSSHKMESKLDQITMELQRSNEELNDFAYTVSHDLKEPLRGIVNYTDFLIQDYGSKLDKTASETFDALKQMATHLNNLIESLLYYSRIGRSEFEFTAVDLNKVVQQAITALKVLIKEKQAEIVITTPLPIVECDPTRLIEVFQNLLSNAIKYNENKPVIAIGCQVQAEGELPQTIIFVRDNGIGIEERNYAKIFKIYKRVHSIHRFGEGLGLGLTIVKKIISRHRGNIWLESKPGAGTTFYLSLPLATQTA